MEFWAAAQNRVVSERKERHVRRWIVAPHTRVDAHIVSCALHKRFVPYLDLIDVAGSNMLKRCFGLDSVSPLRHRVFGFIPLPPVGLDLLRRRRGKDSQDVIW
ncbi:hypothetical protein ATY41_08265 [Leifsonia xyli subsp. xyli]|uniref:Uncharacterized protein n=1 Tax=Leifsonia xyli subsp. xyli TaxID=59736 RepID=A0A1E2SMB1_LEIXY|nr:hypothetical protein ATY41_08265 [Leifsonia xyli subsp. xyli]